MPKKKQQSKFKKFFTWFKPTTPAKGALLFAIAFAVIGGSYMAYKSYATGYNWAQTADQLYKNGSVGVQTDCHASNKGCNHVVVLPFRADYSSNENYAEARYYANLPVGKIVTFCARARGQVPGSKSWSPLLKIEILYDNEQVSHTNYRYWYLSQDTIYRDYCKTVNYRGGFHYWKARVSNEQTSSSNIYLSYINMIW